MTNKIQAKELYAQIQRDGGPRIIDIRSGDEYGAGHIPGALNIPFLRLHYKPGFVPDGEPVILYGSGRPQDETAYEDAVRLLSEQGIQASILDGGFHSWSQGEYPIEIE